MVLALSGCAGLMDTIAPEKLPTIAHAHIGHAITGWKLTPDQKGLFQVAVEEADIAYAHSGYAVERLDNLDLIKLHIGHVMHAVDPGSQREGPGLGFGLKKAVFEAVHHLTYASESDDASENVRNFAEPFAANTEAVIQRCDLILALGKDILQTSSVQDAAALAQEVQNLSRANVKGMDSDGNGVLDANAGEYGLMQLNTQITDMINRENPQYRPVPQRYLFALIRLPDGKWAYRLNKTEKDDEDEGGY